MASVGPHFLEARVRRSDVAGFKDDSVPDHSVPNVHIDGIDVPDSVSPLHDPDNQSLESNKSRTRAINATRQYRPEDIGWLGDK